MQAAMLFSTLFARRQKWCGLCLPVYCSNLSSRLACIATATMKIAMAIFMVAAIFTLAVACRPRAVGQGH